MSRASISVSRITSARPAVDSAAPVSAKRRRRRAGATSWARRWSVQSPPRTTSVGMSGSGMIEPTDSPVPVNSNDVT